MFLLMCVTVHAQEVSLQYFNAESRDKKVYLRWALSAGSTCNGIVISRSVDSVSYEKIGEVFGICGSEDTAQAFDYTDDMPEENKRNYYQIVLGARVAVAVQSAYVNGGGSSYLIPNPVSKYAVLHFDNRHKRPTQIRLYNSLGRPIDLFSTEGSEVKIDVGPYPDGIYIYIVNAAEFNYKGVLTVMH